MVEYDSLGCPDWESGWCHFDTLEHFFKINIIGVNRGKNKFEGGKSSKISQSQQIKHQIYSIEKQQNKFIFIETNLLILRLDRVDRVIID